MAKFSLGDEVLVYEPSYRNGQPGTVTRTTVIKEGRKYVYVDGGGWNIERQPFDKETGRRKTDSSRNDHYDPRLWIPAEWEATEHRREVLEAIRDHGVRFERSWLRGEPVEMPITTLEKLLAVLDEGRR